MKRETAFCLIAAALVGCEQKDRDEIVSHSQVAVNEASKALAVAWRSASEGAQKIDANSTRQQIEEAKRKLEGYGSQLEKGAKQETVAVQAQIDRLDAAKRLKDAQEDLKEKLAAAESAKKKFDDGLSKTREQLDQTNKAYQAVEEKVSEAQKAYDIAAKRAQETYQAATGTP